MLHRYYFINPPRPTFVTPHLIVNVSHLRKVTPSVTHLGSGVWTPNYSCTFPLRTSFLSLQFRLPALQWIYMCLPWLPKELPALLVNCFDFLPQDPSWPSLHLLQAGAEFAPGSGRPFVLRACSSCWEQVAGKAREGVHQQSSSGGGREGRQIRLVSKGILSACPSVT